MSLLSKLDFHALDISGKNYLTWVLDAKVHLTANNLGATIRDGGKASTQDKAKALLFLRHHLHEDLKREYLTIEDPLELWKSINERYDHQKSVILPTARYNWLQLRLQDFPTISEYNSAIFRITSELKLCGEPVTDTEMLEKTLSTFHADNMLLSQQYRERNFTKYSELIACLLVAEQNNKLLLQNHQARPVGATPLPEVHMASHHNRGRGRGRSQYRGRGRGRGNNSWHRNPYNNSSHEGPSNNNRGRAPRGHQNGPKRTTCNKCGMSNHWANTCRTPKHLVEAYLYMKRGKDKKPETNLVIEAQPNLVVENQNVPALEYHLDAADFVENT